MSKPFEELKRARNEKRMSLVQVAEMTGIDTEYLAALENAEFSLLPDPLYVRGFIRRYAKTVGVNAKPILDAYREWEQEVNFIEETNQQVSLPSRSSRYQKNRKAGWKSPGSAIEKFKTLNVKKKRILVSSAVFLILAASAVIWLIIDKVYSGAETVQLNQSSSSAPDSSSAAMVKKRPVVRLAQPAEKSDYGDVYSIENADKVEVRISAVKLAEIQVRSGGPTGEKIAEKTLRAKKTEMFSDPKWLSLRVDHPDHVKIYVNGVLIDTSKQKEVSLYQLKIKEK
ncbi:helix-turn-helix domain-containing protein [Thermoactinomyces mirandus]|uniref:Helix-turn-helix domain-containing protein n=1 Tax=Thermoactinomyces mirandus TaxID=2756294 RepID=A0A7W1XUY9_9BACL|nr:helix-turn-helix domain-containing protein [Thermoactinomyces mirandus]MBA4603735.1 helix-turn-helix domain-containing protein [Thermoactinomyces mirandus]